MGITICPPNILEKQRMGQLFLKNIVTYEVLLTTQIIKSSTGFTRHTVRESAAFDLVRFGKQRLRSYKWLLKVVNRIMYNFTLRQVFVKQPPEMPERVL